MNWHISEDDLYFVVIRRDIVSGLFCLSGLFGLSGSSDKCRSTEKPDKPNEPDKPDQLLIRREPQLRVSQSRGSRGVDAQSIRRLAIRRRF
jgi:hypothetical protein